jgi:uncharacterized membrane protein HdeD (DUF308 family)
MGYWSMNKLSMFVSGLISLFANTALYFVAGDLLFKLSPKHAFVLFGLLLIRFLSSAILKVNVATYLEKLKGDKK